MKKTLLLFCGLTLTSFAAQAQWVAQPISFAESESALVLSLDAVDANVAWASTYDFVASGQSVIILPGTEYARWGKYLD